VSTPERTRHLLTEEDLELLNLLLACANDCAIARRLNISVRTVRRRVARIMDILSVHSRFAAGAAAVSLGWVTYSPGWPHTPEDPDVRRCESPPARREALRNQHLAAR
jgi:DNA-binding CsgD family transcriptional regulator